MKTTYIPLAPSQSAVMKQVRANSAVTRNFTNVAGGAELKWEKFFGPAAGLVAACLQFWEALFLRFEDFSDSIRLFALANENRKP